MLNIDTVICIHYIYRILYRVQWWNRLFHEESVCQQFGAVVGKITVVDGD